MGWMQPCFIGEHKQCPDTWKDSMQCDCPCHLGYGEDEEQ